jgi:hypothetical protein
MTTNTRVFIKICWAALQLSTRWITPYALREIYSNSFRIVTLDGQVLNAGGSMTGGSASSNAGILSGPMSLCF